MLAFHWTSVSYGVSPCEEHAFDVLPLDEQNEREGYEIGNYRHRYRCDLVFPCCLINVLLEDCHTEHRLVSYQI